ncbi:MAG: glycosyltransferase [Planctomycetota bacterium]
MRIVLAWELGGGGGHVTQLAAVAKSLRQHGAEPTLLASRPVDHWTQEPVKPAPRWEPARTLMPTGTWADILLDTCWREDVGPYLDAWRDCVAAEEPDVVVADFAPSALVAARRLGIPAVNVSHGFDVPPSAGDLPNLHALAGMTDADRVDVRLGEKRVVDLLNAHVNEPIDRLADLYRDGPTVLTNRPTLDHFGPRSDGDYVGHFPGPEFPAPAWPDGAEPRVVGYLKPFPALRPLMHLLGATGLSTLAFVPGIEVQRTPPTLRPTAQPFHMATAARNAGLGICHAGVSTVCTFLAAGLPMLLIPLTLEQRILARRAEDLGVAVVVRPDDGEGMRAALQRLLTDDELTEAARRQPALDPEAGLAKAVDVIRGAAG